MHHTTHINTHHVVILLLTTPMSTTLQTHTIKKIIKKLAHAILLWLLQIAPCRASYRCLQGPGNRCTGELYQPNSYASFKNLVTVSKVKEVHKPNSRTECALSTYSMSMSSFNRTYHFPPGLFVSLFHWIKKRSCGYALEHGTKIYDEGTYCMPVMMRGPIVCQL